MGRLPTGYVSRAVSAPVSRLPGYEANRSVSEAAANRNWPSGSRLKALGRASVATCPLAVNRTGGRGDGEAREAVMASIGRVQEGPGGSHLNLGAGVAGLVPGGQGGDGLEGAQGAVGGVEVVPGDARALRVGAIAQVL